MSIFKSSLGKFEEALALNTAALEIDPLNLLNIYNQSGYLLCLGRLDEAESFSKKALEMNPEFITGHSSLGLIYVLQGKAEAAILEMEKETADAYKPYGQGLAYHAAGKKKVSDQALSDLIKNGDFLAFQIAEVYAFRGEVDKAFEWLDRAYKQRDPGLMQMIGDPLLKSIEHDPRYKEFLKKMKFPLD